MGKTGTEDIPYTIRLGHQGSVPNENPNIYSFALGFYATVQPMCEVYQMSQRLRLFLSPGPDELVLHFSQPLLP